MSLCLDVTYRLARGILGVLQKAAVKVQNSGGRAGFIRADGL